MLECLRTRGASFLTDLAADTGLSPAVVRRSLWALLRRSQVTNDHFDVIRRGEEPPLEANVGTAGTRLPSLRDIRRRFVQRPEGRWSLLPWGRPEPEAAALSQAWLLLNRYGVVARELALLDPWLPSWRILYEVLSRLELAGEVRRGYFVEGLSGAQFATSEAADLLQQLHLPSTAMAPVVLLHSMDPANLYGSGAPFDIPLLDGGTRSFHRRLGNWLVVRAGRPVLLVEQQGKRLTALASSSRDDILAAVACLPAMFDNNRALESEAQADRRRMERPADHDDRRQGFTGCRWFCARLPGDDVVRGLALSGRIPFVERMRMNQKRPVWFIPHPFTARGRRASLAFS